MNELIIILCVLFGGVWFGIALYIFSQHLKDGYKWNEKSWYTPYYVFEFILAVVVWVVFTIIGVMN